MKKYMYVGYGKKIKLSDLRKTLNKKRKISIILPTYNEEENIKNIVKAIKKNLKKSKFSNSYEIIIVDDNSKDKTPNIIDNLAKKRNFIALHRYGARGLFPSIRDGIFIANGEYVLTMDADFSHPPELIPKMINYSDKYDIVYCSRFVKDGGMKAPYIRKYGSMLLNKICIFLSGLDVSDFGGQFRLIKKESYLKINFRYNSKFAEYGLELFYRAKKLGLKAKSIPFIYEFREKGKSKMGSILNLPNLGINYLKRAVQLRLENYNYS